MSNAQTPQSLYSLANSSVSTDVFITYFSTVDPTQYNTQFPIGKRWVNTASMEEFILTGFNSSSGTPLAIWTPLQTVAEATKYVTDVRSPAIPAAHSLKVTGGSTSTNNINGIQTDGDSGGAILTIELTNILSEFVTTTDNTPTAIITFGLETTPAVYSFTGEVVAFDVTDTAGASYTLSGGCRTSGAAATLIATNTTNNFQEAALVGAKVALSVSSNNAVITVTGLAGKNITWNALFTYITTV